MKRKVIKQGHNTLTITLPSKWAENLNIKPGDEVNLEELGTSLNISTEKAINLDSISINLTGLDRTSIMYYIRAVYRRGFDEIKVRFDEQYTHHIRIDKKKNIISVIQKEVNRLIGVEVIDQKKDSCVIKDISGDSFKDFDVILRKVFLLTNESLDNIIKGTRTKEKCFLEEVEDKHDTITKFISYCLRLMNQKGYPDYKKSRFIYTIINALDLIADINKYAAREIISYNKIFKKDTISVIELIRTNFNTFYELYYQFNLQKFAKLNEIRDKILKITDKIHNKIPGKELLILRDMEHILEIIREISGTRMGLEY
ncbi:MAG: AbrB/MazE/SpoVT family DNA-binding domain-containing protein [Nanoarchaeota archaeon]|nr:AbrB/MazE/SpoVT family DNA-binding domain-containing protein [Nanoarchaeota archaeon]MBU1704186.1 AbrB/MazE/SpoVT family DNA-binding domain-containing protein [Nanoarchaeota archaeon]